VRSGEQQHHADEQHESDGRFQRVGFLGAIKGGRQSPALSFDNG
jgi:hypothetical protein